jgi:gas vesicle protein
MESLNKQVARARRWLAVQRFVDVLGWCCFATLLAALILIAVDKYRPLGIDPWIWGVGALALGIAVAAAWALVRGPRPIDAAIEIDRRFALKERVSSALSLSDDDRRTLAGQALIDDAVRRVGRLDVGERFAIAPGRQVLLPLLPAVVAVLVALLVHPAGSNQAQAKTDPSIQKQIEQSARELRRRLQQKRDVAKKEGLKDVEHLLARLDEESKDLAERTEGERTKALIQLNDLAKEIQKRRDQLGGADKIQQQLDRLKNVDQGPADKLLEALKQGDFKQAMKEIDKLQSKLNDGGLTREEQERLARQLDQMREKIEKLADAHREAQHDLQRRIDQARQQGRQDEAGQLEEQLDQLQQQAPPMNRLRNLADQLGQCAQCLEDGRLEQAGDVLDSLQSELGDLQQQMRELKLLDDAMNELGQCRNQMTCPHCGGLGCAACRGTGQGAGQGTGEGDGLGHGRGYGDRPEQSDNVGFIDTKPAMKVDKGSASIVGRVDGPNLIGDVQQELQEQYRAIREQSADPLSGQPLSRKQQAHAQEYFDRIREGD